MLAVIKQGENWFCIGKNQPHLESSGNALREVKKYSWKTNKDSNIIDGKVVDFDNRAMDASRYASFQFSRVNSWDYD